MAKAVIDAIQRAPTYLQTLLANMKESAVPYNTEANWLRSNKNIPIIGRAVNALTPMNKITTPLPWMHFVPGAF
jgi:hypothetical protein